MELTTLVRRAREQDVSAFTELTRRTQNMAFGYAYAILGDFQLAEDAVQEAFVAAYFDLAKLEAPEAFAGWLRGIVRHQCHRIVRRRRLTMLPLESAAGVPSDVGLPGEHLERRQARAQVLAALDALPQELREVVTLFYLQERSQREVAAFLGVPPSTVNNRLHAARQRLKRRMLPMAQEILKTNALPDDFAARVGRLIQVRGPIVEAQFDPANLPELLSALTITDEARRVDVPVEVAQRLEDGVVRCVAATPIRDLKPGAKVVPTGEAARVPIGHDLIEEFVRGVAGTRGPAELLETGIKVIDLLCPIAKGGAVGIFGDMRVGKSVLIEELVRSTAMREEGGALFTFVQSAEIAVVQETMQKYPGLAGQGDAVVQTFHLLSERPTDPEYAAALTCFDSVIYLSREVGAAGIWPAVDPLSSTSRLLEPAIVGQEHVAIAQRVRQALQRAREWEAAGAEAASLLAEDAQLLARTRRLRRFFSQPFFVAEPFTGFPPRSVRREETLRACRAILDGEVDDLPEEAFMFVGDLAEARAGD